MNASHFSASETAKFWSTLSKKWKREVCVFRQPFSTSLASPDEYFGLLRRWADATRAGGLAQHSPRWIEDNLLPTEQDGDLDGFCRRVDREYGRDWYLYLGDGAQKWAPYLWERILEVYKPAIELEGGLPAGGVVLDCFLGKYDRTPTGIHRDDLDVLAFSVYGTKKLYFWPKERFESQANWWSTTGTHVQTGIFHYENHLRDAIVVELNPGDVVYWPKEFFHIGASPDHWCGMVTLSMRWTASPTTALAHILQSYVPQVEEVGPYPIEQDDLGRRAREVPEDVAGAAAAVKAGISQRWEPTIASVWARFVSGYGFLTPPGPREVVEHDGPWEVRHPVLAVEAGAATQLYACGHLVGSTANRALGRALGALAVGQSVDPAKAFSTIERADQGKIGQLVRSLAAVGAFG